MKAEASIRGSGFRVHLQEVFNGEHSVSGSLWLHGVQNCTRLRTSRRKTKLNRETTFEALSLQPNAPKPSTLIWVVVKIMVPFWGPYYNTAPIII